MSATSPRASGLPRPVRSLRRLVEDRLRAADDRHPGSVLGQAARGGQPHTAAATDDHRGGIRKPRSMLVHAFASAPGTSACHAKRARKCLR